MSGSVNLPAGATGPQGPTGPTGPGGGQTPWTGNIDGAGFHTFNAAMYDNGINSVIGKSVDPINHVLWSGDFGSGSAPVFDFTGNGGGGSVTAGSRLVYDRGENNFAFFVPLADHNYNPSLDTHARTLTDGGSNLMLDWTGTVDFSAPISFDNSQSPAKVNFYANTHFNNENDFSGTSDFNATVNFNSNVNFTSGGVSFSADVDFGGFGITNVSHITMAGSGPLDMSGGSINNADNVTGNYFSGNGANLTSLSYNNISGVPINGSGDMQTGLNMNGNTLTVYGIFASNSGQNGFTGTVSPVTSITVQDGIVTDVS